VQPRCTARPGATRVERDVVVHDMLKHERTLALHTEE
jgi:hypothetical protein